MKRARSEEKEVHRDYADIAADFTIAKVQKEAADRTYDALVRERDAHPLAKTGAELPDFLVPVLMKHGDAVDGQLLKLRMFNEYSDFHNGKRFWVIEMKWSKSGREEYNVRRKHGLLEDVTPKRNDFTEVAYTPDEEALWKASMAANNDRLRDALACFLTARSRKDGLDYDSDDSFSSVGD